MTHNTDKIEQDVQAALAADAAAITERVRHAQGAVGRRAERRGTKRPSSH